MKGTLVTTLKPIEAPPIKQLEAVCRRNKVGEKLRHFDIIFANPKQWKTCNMMRKFDQWHDKNLFEESTITTRSTLPLEDYKLIVAATMEETGGKLIDIVEVILNS